MADQLFGPVEQLRPGLVDGQARDSLELLDLLVVRLLELLLQLLDVDLAVREALLAAEQLRELAFELVLPGEHAFLELRHMDAALLKRLLLLGPEAHRLLTRLDLALSPKGFRLSPRLRDELVSLSCRFTQARAMLELEDEREERRSENQADGDAGDDEHLALLGVAWARPTGGRLSRSTSGNPPLSSPCRASRKRAAHGRTRSSPASCRWGRVLLRVCSSGGQGRLEFQSR